MRPIRSRACEGPDSLPAASQHARYLITVRGAPRAICSGGPEVSAVENGDGTTTFEVLVDQAGLRGTLCRLWDLNATLVAAIWAPATSEPKRGGVDD